MNTIRAVFLDRDGTINVNRPDYVKSVAEFEFLPGALEALALLAKLPVLTFIVSNQSAVGRGLMTDDALDKITAHMLREIFNAGGRIDGVYYCRHAPDAGCKCRKPGTALFDTPLKYYGVDQYESWMIGDSETDWETGMALDMHTVLVRTGKHVPKYEIDHSVNDLRAAVTLISRKL